MNSPTLPSDTADRALTLHQPWASLAALGNKPFETRSWAPPAWLIGRRFVVHAAKKMHVKHDNQTALDIVSALGSDWTTTLPLGAALGTVRLLGAWKTGSSEAVPFSRDRRVRLIDKVPGSPNLDYADVDRFGDYSPGRWIWRLSDLAPFQSPIPCLGYQGLWKWPRPATVDGGVFLSRATYEGTRQLSPEASEEYRVHALESAQKLRARQAARAKLGA